MYNIVIILSGSVRTKIMECPRLRAVLLYACHSVVRRFVMTYIIFYYWSLERHYKRFALHNTDIMYSVSSSSILFSCFQNNYHHNYYCYYITYEHIIYFILIRLSSVTYGLIKIYPRWKIMFYKRLKTFFVNIDNADGVFFTI